ncbi:MAG: MgtC/SapB family protein [Clostridia bacterium]|nr:MgtC/SapB family protein [Clostridia bacterium]
MDKLMWYDVLLRLVVSTLIGLFIGLERERHHRPAGMKTHIMVCLGATIVSLIQVQIVCQALEIASSDPAYASVLGADLGRMGAQVISGIGFLGAGTILVKKGSIKGLTTAATLWLTACLGLAVGMGYILIAVEAFAMVMAVLILLRVIQKIQFNRNIVSFEIYFSDSVHGMQILRNFCFAREIEIIGSELSEGYDTRDGHGVFTMRVPMKLDKSQLIYELAKEEYIDRVNIVEE